MTRLGSKGCKILSHLKSVLKKDARSSPHFADRQKRILQKADDPQATAWSFFSPGVGTGLPGGVAFHGTLRRGTEAAVSDFLGRALCRVETQEPLRRRRRLRPDASGRASEICLSQKTFNSLPPGHRQQASGRVLEGPALQVGKATSC